MLREKLKGPIVIYGKCAAAKRQSRKQEKGR
jgi:hypothetical protein